MSHGLAALNGMDASLIVAIAGLTLAGASLTWQAATDVLTGGRVKDTDPHHPDGHTADLTFKPARRFDGQVTVG